jgi:hypothetical protein
MRLNHCAALLGERSVKTELLPFQSFIDPYQNGLPVWDWQAVS